MGRNGRSATRDQGDTRPFAQALVHSEGQFDGGDLAADHDHAQGLFFGQGHQRSPELHEVVDGSVEQRVFAGACNGVAVRIRRAIDAECVVLERVAVRKRDLAVRSVEGQGVAVDERGACTPCQRCQGDTAVVV